MKTQLNEIKRMQQLAGVISESSEIEEGPFAGIRKALAFNTRYLDANDAFQKAISYLKKLGITYEDKNIFSNKGKRFTLQIKDVNFNKDKVTYVLDNQGIEVDSDDFLSDLKSRLKKSGKLSESYSEETLKSVREATTTPSDVAALGKAQAASTTVASRAKAINSIQEFPGAFEVWFKTLGLEPGKISKSAVRSEVEKVLIKLGYK